MPRQPMEPHSPPAGSAAPKRKVKTKKEQWYAFQKVWLANLRRELLGTDEHFGNPTDNQQDPATRPMYLPEVEVDASGGLAKRTLILDLDETLVHTEFEQSRGWVTHRRPHVSKFLGEMAKDYELVCFTSGLKPYASPIVDHLDPDDQKRMISHRLYRDHTLSMKGLHVKDLSRLNRDLARTIIIDNSPESYLMQPENAIPIKSFFGDSTDRCLLDLIPFLQDIVRRDVRDVRSVLKKCHIKGRFAARTRSGSRLEEMQASEGQRERQVSDIGLAAPDIAEFDPEEVGQRCRSMSDVDRVPEDMGVVTVVEGETWPPPIIIDVAPDESLGMPLSPLNPSHPSHAKAKHMPSLSLADASHQPPHSEPRYHRELSWRQMESEVMVDDVREAKAHTPTSHGTVRRGGEAGEGGGGGDGSSDALLDWSAVHGSFAEVLRGMSPPPSIGLTPNGTLVMGGKSDAA